MNTALAHNFDTEKRAYERTPVKIFGRCLMPNGLEIPCQAVDISPGDVGLVAGHSPKIGETVVVYLDHVGRIDGPTVRVFEGGFALLIACTPRRREKLAARVEWLKNRDTFGSADMRLHERIEPRNRNSEIQLDDGRKYPVEIIDISLSGAAISSEVKPAIGTRIMLSGMKGVVVRHFTEGLAIEFVKSLDHEADRNALSV